jgi:hypothetical protein
MAFVDQFCQFAALVFGVKSIADAIHAAIDRGSVLFLRKIIWASGNTARYLAAWRSPSLVGDSNQDLSHSRPEGRLASGECTKLYRPPFHQCGTTISADLTEHWLGRMMHQLPVFHLTVADEARRKEGK